MDPVTVTPDIQAQFEEDERKKKEAAAAASAPAGITPLADLGPAGAPPDLTGVPPLTGAGPGGMKTVTGDPTVVPGAPPAPATTPAPAAPITATTPADSSLTTTTHNSNHQVTGVKVSKEEIDSQKKQAELDTAAVKAQEARNKADGARAELNAKLANEEKTRTENHAAEVARVSKAAEDDVKARVAKADADDAEHRAMLKDLYNPKNGFWQKASTPEKIKGGISLLLGVFGGISDGKNVGAERIIKANEDDTAHREKVLEEHGKILANSRDAATKAKASGVADAMKGLDLRTAAGIDAAAADAIARGKALGIPEAELTGNEAILKLKQHAQDLRQKWLEDTTRKATVDASSNSSVTQTGTGVGGATDTRNKPSTEDLNVVNQGGAIMKQIDDGLKIIEDPKSEGAWKRVVKNNQDWQKGETWNNIPVLKQLRAGGQIVGAIPTAPEGNLKGDPQAIAIHRVISSLTEALAKMSGGVITTSDRQGAQSQLALAAVSQPAEAAQLLRQVRAKIENGVKLTVDNRNMVVPGGVLPGSGGATPAAGAGPKVGDKVKTKTGKTLVWSGAKWEYGA